MAVPMAPLTPLLEITPVTKDLGRELVVRSMTRHGVQGLQCRNETGLDATGPGALRRIECSRLTHATRLKLVHWLPTGGWACHQTLASSRHVHQSQRRKFSERTDLDQRRRADSCRRTASGGARERTRLAAPGHPSSPWRRAHLEFFQQFFRSESMVPDRYTSLREPLLSFAP